MREARALVLYGSRVPLPITRRLRKQEGPDWAQQGESSCVQSKTLTYRKKATVVQDRKITKTNTQYARMANDITPKVFQRNQPILSLSLSLSSSAKFSLPIVISFETVVPNLLVAPHE